MCVYITKPSDARSSLFDPSLTPQNARRKGYTYIDDVIYDFQNPGEAINDILDFSRQFHCKFGTPSGTGLDSCFGLYIPDSATS